MVRCITGSSPRVRGTALRFREVAGEDRFIPACAGNRIAVRTVTIPTSVHPRVCGEQVGGDRASLNRNRFIPACAGNSSAAYMAGRSSTPVHPRVCGEQTRSLFLWCQRNGSSPRVRGTGVCHLRRVGRRRFIPACAGNSRSRGSPDRSVHPRVCGEPSRILASDRFIPACAGNRLDFMSLIYCGLYGVAISTGNGQCGGSGQGLDQRPPFFGGGAKQTSLSPSNSRGIRRLTPTVSKSKP